MAKRELVARPYFDLKSLLPGREDVPRAVGVGWFGKHPLPCVDPNVLPQRGSAEVGTPIESGGCGDEGVQQS